MMYQALIVDHPVTQVNDFGPSGFNLSVHNILLKAWAEKHTGTGW